MNKIFLDEWVTVVLTKIKGSTFRLTFSHLKPIKTRGGGKCAPLAPVTYLCITIQIHERAEKNLTFPNYEFGKGRYAFYPMKLSRFANKKYSLSEIP